MSNLIDVVNRTRAINTEIRTIRRQPDISLVDLKRVASLQVELLRLCPPQRYIWLGGKPAIDILGELSACAAKKENFDLSSKTQELMSGCASEQIKRITGSLEVGKLMSRCVSENSGRGVAASLKAQRENLTK